MIGSPAAPTVAPIGSSEALASVAVRRGRVGRGGQRAGRRRAAAAAQRDALELDVGPLESVCSCVSRLGVSASTGTALPSVTSCW